MRYSISRQPPGALHLFSRFSPVCAVLFCTNRASEGFRPTGDGGQSLALDGAMVRGIHLSQRGEKISLSGNFRQAGNYEW